MLAPVPLHLIVFTLLWSGACGYALVRGGTPERLVATLIVLGSVLSPLVVGVRAETYRHFSVGVFAVDCGMLVILVGVALTSTRFWPMLMASLQGAGVLAHVARLLGAGIIPLAYAATVVFWSYPILVLLGLATFRHQRRLRRFGRDPGWISGPSFVDERGTTRLEPPRADRNGASAHRVDD